MPFVPHTAQERAAMLETIGVKSLDELFNDIPPALRLTGLRMPDGLSEQEVYERLHALSHQNAHGVTGFIGGGFYDHVVPAAVDALAARGEFFTAYTPYQPEVAQGTLQAIFEFQSMICRLTGLDAANASMYDGGTALAEAVLMAVRTTGRNTVVMAGGVNPVYRSMIKSFALNLDVQFVELSAVIGAPLDRIEVASVLNERVACVVVQNPDFFGSVDDFSDVAEMAHRAGALLVSSNYPVALGLLKRPGEMGVDIATGEGQSLGLPLSFGGPYLGFFAVRQPLLRKMPGRVVGESLDRRGKRCFVLTLQAREQHIRREKATSNICTNQALCALRATIHLALLGKQGVREQAEICARKAAYAQRRLTQIKGVRIKNQGAVFNEFVLELPLDAESVSARLLQHGFAPGIPLGRYFPDGGNALLTALTEKRSKAEIDGFAEQLEGVL